MKKIIIGLIFILSLMQITVMAKENDFTLYSKDSFIKEITTTKSIDNAMLVLYKNDKTISSAYTLDFENNKAITSIPTPLNDEFIKIYYNIGTDNVSYINTDDIKALPSEETKLPNTYPTDAAAIDAIAVIKSVNTIVLDNNEIVNRINCLYQGIEIFIDVDENFTITAGNNDMKMYEGMNISTLSEGDIVSFSASLSGKLRKVNLLFKPYKTDIITEDNNILFQSFNDKFSTYGVIADKLKNDTIVLYDKTGLEKNALYLDLYDDASVYVYDMSKRKDKISIGTKADIIKSEISPKDIDEDDNILSWGDNRRNYAYVRVYDNMVCDIVVFANYNS